MRIAIVRHRLIAGFLCLSLLASLTLLTNCSGGGKGGSGDASSVFNNRNINLYVEVPAILIQGNEDRDFNPKTSVTAELYDSNNDGIEDEPINEFSSYANAANNMLDIDLAACVGKSGQAPQPPVVPPGEKHIGYTAPEPWVDSSEFPDTMPATAAGTSSTQFVQLIVPFKLNHDSIFLNGTAELSWLNPDYLTLEDELWNEGTGTPADLVNSHVPCTVLVDGEDKDGNGPFIGDTTAYSTFWPQLENTGVNINPGAGKSSIVFIAQDTAGELGVDDMQAFTLWASQVEMRIHFKKVIDSKGNMIHVDSKWYVLRQGATPVEPVVESIQAFDMLTDGNGNPVLDWDDPAATGPGDPRNTEVILRTTNFIVRFSKPVIPETVAQSIVFGGAPFNGNMEPLPTKYTFGQTLDPPCADSGTYRDPIATNIALVTSLYLEDGTPSNIQGVVPFRCYPLHQNNLCTYLLNPIIDIPGSSEVGSPPFEDPLVPDITRMRLTVQVFMHDMNQLTGKPVSILPWPSGAAVEPTNMGISGYFAVTNSPDGETILTDATSLTKTYTVNHGGRYVNAPVSPHALYYAMGPYGMGVVDLDGNGFTTNDPDFEKTALVTSQLYYSGTGNAGMGLGNNYAYAAKATRDPATGLSTYLGLGNNTPMPGINEGSTGIDEVVKDSNGLAQLYPDPLGPVKFSNLTDIEVGEFLDTMFFDGGNEWAHPSFHLSAINTAAIGNWSNNMISTPPTPNPPPLTVPVGMRPEHVGLDFFSILEEGAFVIMGKEVFMVDLVGLSTAVAPAFTPVRTGFVHLNPAELAGTAIDLSFPPNTNTWVSNLPPPIGSFPPVPPPILLQGSPRYMNLGPVADSSSIGYGWYYGSRQAIGNFLFVTDKANNVVRVLNSNTMDLITNLTGLSAPDGLGITMDLKNLYVSNSGGQSVSVFNVNPRTSGFLTKVAQIPVGSNPKGVCVQPENEDVFICNYGSSTISIINPKTNTVRKTVSSLLKKPWDMVVGPRQVQFGFGTQVYHGYVSNFGGDNVVIYESGPDGLGGVGYDGILDPVPSTGTGGQQYLPIQQPRGLCWDPTAGLQYPLTGGCYVAHRSGSYGVVSNIEFTAQQAPWGPIFLIPNAGSIGGTPGFGKRIFNITSQWGGKDNPLTGSAAADVATIDYNREAWENDSWINNFYVTNLGDLSGPQTWLPLNNKNPIRFATAGYQSTCNPDRLYISYQYDPIIDVINPTSGELMKTITGLPAGAKVLKNYFK